MDRPYTVSKTRYWPTLRAINAAAAAGEWLGLQLGTLEYESIVRAATRSTGLDDFGDPDFLPFLRRFLDIINSYPSTPLGRIGFRSLAVAGLSNRLLNREYARQHPDVADVPIERPVFVVGFPRTGTTLLQNLLSQEQGARALAFWELYTPSPVHADREMDVRKRQRMAAQVLGVANLAAPETRIVHDITATSKEECWYLFVPAFAVLNWDLQSGYSRWGNWLMRQDMTIAYREYRRTLQLLAHWSPTRRFVLKCPEHLWFIDALLEVFPDACIVWPHRDPAKVISSYASMMSLTRRTWWGYIDHEAHGAHIMDRLRTGITRALEVRDRVGSDRFYDVNFEELIADPTGVASDIYRHFELPYSEQTAQGMRDFMDQPRKDKPGVHVYSAEQWGLSDDGIRRRFADYIERFSIPVPAGKRGIVAA